MGCVKVSVAHLCSPLDYASLLREGISQNIALLAQFIHRTLVHTHKSTVAAQSAVAILEWARILFPNRKKIYGNGSMAAVRKANRDVAHCRFHLVLARAVFPDGP